MSDRKALAQAFLDRTGWGAARRAFLAGDASDRSYDRLWRGDETAILMDSPPGHGDDPAQFVAISRHLAQLGLSPPQILAQDLAYGFLLIEDLGDALFARIMAEDPNQERGLILAATDVLLALQAHSAPDGLDNLSPADWALAAAFALDFYAATITGRAPDQQAFTDHLTAAIFAHANGPRVMTLRDYHAENLLYLPQRRGIARVGLLDFQLAQLGQPGYDLISLLQDARRDVSPKAAEAAIAHFAIRTGQDLQTFHTSLAVLGAQRALRIIGVFARLCTHGGKPGYLRLIPRVWGHLQANLSHPALGGLAQVCTAVLPPPTPENLKRIATLCPTPCL
jgi:aminoglycoside/choline kinase family phosphotransferase